MGPKKPKPSQSANGANAVPSCGYNDLADSVSGPEKAGVGGSIPSLATMFSITYRPPETQFHSISFQTFGPPGCASGMNPCVWGI